ncbi:L-amino acid N-acyltransferase YncA [Faunimonas pinastri]|uniref:L-amino acid N-acyltransferase YncA n=1 Tax=Faunimonas pinastri TaxID=1855383 RepID=A0A1H9GQS7_9HYPH|nr:GNAT family N-acetyltransferase [Faunimonas pinastri]SEQ52477.1 L-amino acid N-acyltransferase YncA [Faunimonas pinastri]
MAEGAGEDLTIEALEPEAAEAALPDLAAVLVDAVAGGASVNFMAGFTTTEAETFWRGQLPGVADGTRTILVARAAGGRILGTVVVTLAPQPNAPHRAEIGKMLVHSSVRRRGLGRRLLAAAEASALASGRTLLILDTQSGSPGEALYRSCGWTETGVLPGHSFTPEGVLASATFFYKKIEP